MIGLYNTKYTLFYLFYIKKIKNIQNSDNDIAFNADVYQTQTLNLS